VQIYSDETFLIFIHERATAITTTTTPLLMLLNSEMTGYNGRVTKAPTFGRSQLEPSARKPTIFREVVMVSVSPAKKIPGLLIPT
jgi:hypothetical protein